MREAGLPQMQADDRGERALFAGATGVVRAVYPDRWRVDLETDDGSLLTEVLVIGPYLPQLHADGADPSHVGYLYMRGGPEAVCWPMPHRRLVGPHDQPGDEQPERRYFHRHSYIFRSGDMTVRITDDQRFVIESEQGDYIIYDQNSREIRLHAPTVYVGTTTDAGRIEYQQDTLTRAFTPVILLGTETQTRIEYQQDAHVKIAMPQILLGDQALPDTDGLTYLAQELLHLVTPFFKVTADTIVLDPTRIYLGHQNATERVMLGDLFMSFINIFFALYNGHTHSNVQNGPGTSGPPTASTPPMTDSMLSDVTRVSKTGL